MTSLAPLYADYIMPTYGRFDFHSHPEVTEAVTKQASTLVHTSNLYRTAPQAHLGEKLVGIAGPGKVFFCNSGAEANEGLIKLTRKFGSATGRYEIITFTNSFHGRTMAGISATGQDKVKKGFAPLLDGFTHVPFGDLAAVEQAITPKTAGILLEPVQGEGGIHIATAEFLRGLRKLCDERDLLLLFDEIQCGLGRTGHWCGWQSLVPDIAPDAISWAKGIANGFPLGAFWATSGRGGLCDLLGPGTHGTTYGGNPVSCAAGLKVLEIIERDGLIAHAATQGDRLAQGLRALQNPAIATVRHIGLMIGIELREGLPALDVVKRLMADGLLTIPAGERVVRLLPPLNVTPEEIDKAIAQIDQALRA